jgi:hypothetical protein
MVISNTNGKYSPLGIALDAVARGISVLPIRRDGSKAPEANFLPNHTDPETGESKRSWLPLQRDIPSEEIIRYWFDRSEPPGIAYIGGEVSGCLECIDFDVDAERIFPAWCALVEADYPGLVRRLSVRLTPSGGRHVCFRVPDGKIPGNRLLAKPAGGGKLYIETRGEGGYFLVPGSPADCHPAKRLYEVLEGHPLEPPAVSLDEWEAMIAYARSFDESTPKAASNWGKFITGVDLKPGEDFDQRGRWEDVLTPHGWTVVSGGTAGERRWRRPGKDRGWSATTGKCTGSDGTDLFHVFSSSVSPLEAGQSYGKFRTYALLSHRGDLSAAARALAARGYGKNSNGQNHAGNGFTGNGHTNNGHPSNGQPTGQPTRSMALAPYVPFPVDALPKPLCDYVEASAAALQCDPALVAPHVFAVAAGAIGNRCAIELKRGWTEPSIVWALTVAPSGQLKSPAFDAAVQPYMYLQLDLIEEHEAKATARSNWKSRPTDERGPEPEDPGEEPCLLTSDTTIEMAGELLRDNPGGILVSRDELDSWFQSFTRFKNGGATDRPHWLELHRGSTLRLHRLTRERGPLTVPRASCSVCGTIQPSVLTRCLTQDAIDAGLAARFLMAMPPRRERCWTEATVEQRLIDRYQTLLRTIHALPMANRQRRRPHKLKLSAEAKEVWVPWFNKWCKRQTDSQDDQAAVLAKLEAYAARLGLLHHVVSWVAVGGDPMREIEPVSIEAGIRLVEWFANEAWRIYTALRESGDQRQQRTLIEWIAARGGRVSVRQLLDSNRSRYPSSDIATAALQALVDAKLGEWLDVPPGPKGGRPSKAFVLRDTHDDPDEDGV